MLWPKAPLNVSGFHRIRTITVAPDTGAQTSKAVWGSPLPRLGKLLRGDLSYPLLGASYGNPAYNSYYCNPRLPLLTPPVMRTKATFYPVAAPCRERAGIVGGNEGEIEGGGFAS